MASANNRSGKWFARTRVRADHSAHSLVQDTTKVLLCAVEKSVSTPAFTRYDATACRTSPTAQGLCVLEE